MVKLTTDNEAVRRGTGNERRLDAAQVESYVGHIFFIVIRVIIATGIERVHLFVSRTERCGLCERRSRGYCRGGRRHHDNSISVARQPVGMVRY